MPWAVVGWVAVAAGAVVVVLGAVAVAAAAGAAVVCCVAVGAGWVTGLLTVRGRTRLRLTAASEQSTEIMVPATRRPSSTVKTFFIINNLL